MKDHERARDDAYPLVDNNIGEHPKNYYRREGWNACYEWFTSHKHNLELSYCHVMNEKYDKLTKEAEALALTIIKMDNMITYDKFKEPIRKALARWKEFRGEL